MVYFLDTCGDHIWKLSYLKEVVKIFHMKQFELKLKEKITSIIRTKTFVLIINKIIDYLKKKIFLLFWFVEQTLKKKFVQYIILLVLFNFLEISQNFENNLPKFTDLRNKNRNAKVFEKNNSATETSCCSL